MGQARRYILNCDWERPSGVTTVTGTSEYSLLDAFSGTSIFDSGSTFSYSAITTVELSDLSDADYEQRAEDFLSYISQFEYSFTLSGLTALIESGQYEEVLCVAPTTTTTTTIAPTTTTTTVPITTTTTTAVATTTTTTEPTVDLTWVLSGGSDNASVDSPDKTTYWNLELSQPLTAGQFISIIINYELDNAAVNALQQESNLRASSGITSGTIITGNIGVDDNLGFGSGNKTGSFAYGLNLGDVVATQQLRIGLRARIDGDGSTSGSVTANITNTSVFVDSGVIANITNPTAPITVVTSNP